MHSRLAFDRPETKDQAMTDSDRLAIAKAWGLLWASDSTDPCVIEARRILHPIIEKQRAAEGHTVGMLYAATARN